MDLSESEEIFEINDFTTASDWEKFVSHLEELIHDWKLNVAVDFVPLSSGTLTNGNWQTKMQPIKFGELEFNFVYSCLDVAEKFVRSGSRNDADCSSGDTDDTDLISKLSPFADMMSSDNDFPSRAHCLSRWYGLREFIVIHPQSSDNVVVSESRIKILLSSCNLAISNTGCRAPMFLQTHQGWRRIYSGVFADYRLGVRTDYQIVHLNQIADKHKYLSGFLGLFREKLQSNGSSALLNTSVSACVRFTYVRYFDHSRFQWQPGCGAAAGVGQRWSSVPFGCNSEPLLELHLSTTWPAISEDIFVETENYTDLDPANAPRWALRARCSDAADHLLLHNVATRFCELLARNDSQTDVLKLAALAAPPASSSPNLIGSSPNSQQPIGKALDRLTQPAVMQLAKSSSATPGKSTAADCEQPIRMHEPVADGEYWSQLSLEGRSMGFDDNDWLREAKGRIYEELADQLAKQSKTAPSDSPLWPLVTAMLIGQSECGALVNFIQQWHRFLDRLRYCWDTGRALPGFAASSADNPNFNYCLLHQKLQMLQVCIDRRLQAQSRQYTPARRSKSKSESPEVAKVNTEPQSVGGDAPSSDEEFYDADEEPAEWAGVKAEPAAAKMEVDQLPTDAADEVLRDCVYVHPELRLLASGKPLLVPRTQEPAPLTEDGVEEQTRILTELGDSPEGAALRARLQSASLLSDMQAFKAVNPNAQLADFVRWHSPRDWIEQTPGVGRLSERMAQPDNLWLECWTTARAVPVSRQKRLFDETREAEKVFHFFTQSLSVSALAAHLLPLVAHVLCRRVLVACAAVETHLVRRASSYEAHLRRLHSHLNSLVQLGVSLSRASPSNSVGRISTLPSLLDKVRVVETQLSQLATVAEKFYAGETAEREGGAGASAVDRVVQSLVTTPETDVQNGAATSGALYDRLLKLFGPALAQPVGREYILRATVARPNVCSRPLAQRLFCIMTPEGVRLAGAFSSDMLFS